jgi:Flp pilus assembly protein TadD
MRRLILFLSLALLFAAAPARAEWRRAESPHFVVYSEESEARLRERILLLEDYDRLLRILTTVEGDTAPTKLNVYIVSGTRDIQVIRPGMGRFVAGFYTATPFGIAAFVDSDVAVGARRNDDNEVLFHEYAHHFMMQYAPNPYPAWYIEGFAEYYQTARFRESAIEFGNYSQARAYIVDPSQWLPMERVLFGDTSGMDERQIAYFYAQAWLTVHYFFSTPERQQVLRRYLNGRHGENTEEAFQAATGFTATRFRDELRRYIRNGQIAYHRMTRASVETPPPVTVTPLTASASDLVLYEAALRIGVEESNQARFLERVRGIARRHPQDPYAQRVLAHAEILFGEPATAQRLLEPLLAAAPNDAELLYLKGMYHLTAAQKGEDSDNQAREARRWFTRAHRADPNHFQTLYRFAESLRGEPEYGSENTRNVLLLAHELAPQVSDITMNAALLLMSRREFDDAEALLLPLAYDPHNASLREAARRLLEQARTHTVPGADEQAPATEG